jgi:hypothetical protein
MSADDFTPLKVIGRGAFGEVNPSLPFEKQQNSIISPVGSSCSKT